MAAKARPIVLADGFGDRHRLLVARFRAAGTRGLTGREMRAEVGNGWRDVMGDLRRGGYFFHAHNSQFDGRPFRWVLRAEPPALANAASASHACDHCQGPGADRLATCKACGESVWVHHACRRLWLRGACNAAPAAPDLEPALFDTTREAS